MAAQSGQGADVMVDGYAYGSLSMTAYTLGLAGGETAADGGVAAAAFPETTPPDGSNT
jgi:4,5-DOPA dioxygenase extradiol